MKLQLFLKMPKLNKVHLSWPHKIGLGLQPLFPRSHTLCQPAGSYHLLDPFPDCWLAQDKLKEGQRRTHTLQNFFPLRINTRNLSRPIFLSFLDKDWYNIKQVSSSNRSSLVFVLELKYLVLWELLLPAVSAPTHAQMASGKNTFINRNVSEIDAGSQNCTQGAPQ